MESFANPDLCCNMTCGEMFLRTEPGVDVGPDEIRRLERMTEKDNGLL